MTDKKTNPLIRFGFSFNRNGVHSSRTMMLEELTSLLSHVKDPDASKEDYLKAIIEDNCLGKRSGKTRILTARHLVDLYALDPKVPIFRTLRYLWDRDKEARPQLALLCAISRDTIFRASVPLVLDTYPGQRVSREKMEELIDSVEPGRFSKATLKSVAQNINSTWTQSGHLTGRKEKIRSSVVPTCGAVAYALFLGYLQGDRGEGFFQNQYVGILECSAARASELAEEASLKGWIALKKIGTVVDIQFPLFLTKEELEWLHE